jgi:thiol-disulfide isomerase/thioredoxin
MGRPEAAAIDSARAVVQAKTARPRAAAERRALLVLAAVAAFLSAVPVLRLARGARPAGSDLVLHARPRELVDLRFSGGAGRPTSLAAFRGRVVLLNVWATWCPPCLEEMPTLDRLQAALGGPGFEVVALSIDHGGLPVVQAFFDRTSIKHLQPYMDTFGDAQSNLAVAGVPLTLLIDREGREIGRKLGPAVWDNPRMVQLIRSRMAPGAAPSQPARR